jgi:hypothetical protein
MCLAPEARGTDPTPPSASSTLTAVSRSVAQDQGGWAIDYRLRYRGPVGLKVAPAEVLAKVEGWVSNSRVSAHAMPRLSSLIVSGSPVLTASADVLTAAEEAQRCRERMTLRISADGAPPHNRPPVLSIAPGGIVRVRLKLEHLHFLYGDYDPLLGARAFELRLGAATFRDALPLDREQYVAQPPYTWPAPPVDRLDTQHFVSAPDSLHLEAHVPGNQSYRFPERPIRYATLMRLSYWYFIAAGSEGRFSARIAQYRETPTAWKPLADGSHEQCLTAVGRWVKVERLFRTEPEATTLALDFRIGGDTNIGELWIDDVSLEPVEGLISARP